ncbi:hypothetical protein LPJ77_004279 [Coemansia sp. RSA 2523]|nr:hypothetical protein LPJ69_003528 [Coemansia sp. RSA 1752]KAJ1805343.1 hypothetical protein LPJ77_004279 [Coemansia sp. RSA 2523]KAJ2149786.1 hypothetical protein J3F82_004373 [Coemansia sp. RSA 637]KAJ2190316.1 hypothetical protein IW144_005416 [Coemansia sp. RSA 522]KAJ2251606.1 hypothetical protein GGH98_003263 [Coemansia sp. RSA 454]KAJ2270169.1 hypothetical protein GGH14_005278 [Coemansia sp. RSA 370]KAJ2530036.1 hypothetical protein IWW43_004558 [Coemansia sp. RSA 1935]KAJ2593733.1 
MSFLTPSRLFGCVPLDVGVASLGVVLCVWHGLQTASNIRSIWAAYHLWMAVSSCAGVYAQQRRDAGHARWFAFALAIDTCISLMASEIPDKEQCVIARRANPGLSMAECLSHVHEIHFIARTLRACVVVLKAHLVLAVYAFDLSLAVANQ